MKIKRIKTIPAAFSDFAATFNEAAEQIERAVKFSSNDGSVSINESDNGFNLSAKGGGGGSGGSGLPSGSTGDMLYHDGSDWVVLAAPTVSVANPVLRHNGTAPYWEEPESC